MGVADLQYQGNVFVSEWNGCPDAALKKLGVGGTHVALHFRLTVRFLVVAVLHLRFRLRLDFDLSVAPIGDLAVDLHAVAHVFLKIAIVGHQHVVVHRADLVKRHG